MERARHHARTLMNRQIAWKKNQRAKGLSTNPKRANDPATVDEEEVQQLERALGQSIEDLSELQKEEEAEEKKVENIVDNFDSTATSGSITTGDTQPDYVISDDDSGEDED